MARPRSTPPETPPDAETPEPTLTPARPSLIEVAAELRLAPDQVRDLYTAEVSAQDDQCHTTPWSEWLTTALIRRVEVAVEHGPRHGSSDPQVRALEADHSKRVPVTPTVPND